MSTPSPSPSEKAVLLLKLEQLGREVAEENNLPPVIRVICTGPGSTYAEIRMDKGTNGKFRTIATDYNLAELPAEINIRIIDANGKEITAKGHRP